MSDNKRGDPTCSICQLRYSAHSGDLCRACFVPVEHHMVEQQKACWRGRARMARAKREAGLTLNEVEHEALRREPNPEILSIGGYRPVYDR